MLAIIAHIGADGATGHAIEFAGSAIRALSIEGRLTLCNMSIEAGARCGMVAPDETTFAYLKGRPYAPKGAEFDQAVEEWSALTTDTGAAFDREVTLDAERHRADRHLGHQPRGRAADRRQRARSGARAGRGPRQLSARRAGLHGHRAGQEAHRHRGRSRVHRLLHQLAHRGFARRGGGARRAAPARCRAWCPPARRSIKRQAEEEGLDRIFRDAGLEWGESGCSMCVGINGDLVAPGERCASTTNRNFRGRQGPGARTHLMSPAMVAAAAVSGHLADVRPLLAGRKV